MPTFLDAAYQVLKDADRPMSYEEITRHALDRSILTTRGKTPASTMSARLYMDIKEKGTESRFVQTGPNQFALNDQRTTLLLITPKSATSQSSPKYRMPRRNAIDSQASSVHKLLDREISSIQDFLGRKSEQPPTSEKICDWVTMCYSLGLYPEGAELFGFVDLLEVNEWYYERTKKMARLCTLHENNQRA